MAVHCPVCGWRFGTDVALRKHLHTHHPWAETEVDSQAQPPPEPAGGWRGKDLAETKPSVGGIRVFLSYVAVLFTPIVGFAAGIFLLIRGRRGHGIAVMLISVAMVVAALAVPEGSTDHHLKECHRHHGVRLLADRQLAGCLSRGGGSPGPHARPHH